MCRRQHNSLQTFRSWWQQRQNLALRSLAFCLVLERPTIGLRVAFRYHLDCFLLQHHCNMPKVMCAWHAGALCTDATALMPASQLQPAEPARGDAQLGSALTAGASRSAAAPFSANAVLSPAAAAAQHAEASSSVQEAAPFRSRRTRADRRAAAEPAARAVMSGPSAAVPSTGLYS